IDFQARYIKDLLELSDYPSFPVEEQAELFKKWLKDKQADIMGFRNKTYQSTVTGTMAAKLPRPWLDIKDDTLEGFMSLKFQKAEATAQAEIAEAETVEA
ncbi:MAG: NAD(P)/FAD-dependent oxidoreductase, partial [Alcaligenaceae bacterium]|nr:NAD(P)/FAD-dependent oxidoreductase [Alcaligenaceae bacterium]